MACSRDVPAGNRCVRALLRCSLALWLSTGGGFAGAVTLAEKARESGCTSKPALLEGTMYRCTTASGANSYFNLPGGTVDSVVRPKAATAPTPSNFPRVDPGTQKGRDDLRRKVLGEELASEEKLLAEARVAYANGAPPPLPEEQADAERYRARIARLRESGQLHERNIDALKKELGAGK